jgi:hypothetical protein
VRKLYQALGTDIEATPSLHGLNARRQFGVDGDDLVTVRSPLTSDDRAADDARLRILAASVKIGTADHRYFLPDKMLIPDGVNEGALHPARLLIVDPTNDRCPDAYHRDLADRLTLNSAAASVSRHHRVVAAGGRGHVVQGRRFYRHFVDVGMAAARGAGGDE